MSSSRFGFVSQVRCRYLDRCARLHYTRGLRAFREQSCTGRTARRGVTRVDVRKTPPVVRADFLLWPPRLVVPWEAIKFGSGFISFLISYFIPISRRPLRSASPTIIKSGPQTGPRHSCLHESTPRISVLRSMPDRVKAIVTWLQVGLNNAGPGE